jgi:hypothetical protein
MKMMQSAKGARRRLFIVRAVLFFDDMAQVFILVAPRFH